MPFDRAFESEHSKINVIFALQFSRDMISFPEFLSKSERPILRHYKYQSTQPELSELFLLHSIYI